MKATPSISQIFTTETFPPEIRMNIDCLLLAGVWVGPVKANQGILLNAILDKVRELNSVGVDVKTPAGVKVVRVKLLCAIFDKPAKASATNMKQFNGEYGCTYCTDKGTVIGRNTRVYLPDDTHITRTPHDMGQWVRDAERTGSPVFGVKGRSVFSKDLQLPQCIPIDYMHAVLEGVFKNLMKSWFDSSNHGERYYIGRYRKDIDKAIARIKPPSDFRRTPRSVELTSFWKASEFRVWLLYFSLPVLKAFLPTEYLHHLSLLVGSMHILLSESIHKDSLDQVEGMLQLHYRMYPQLYSERHCTWNVHDLIHIVSHVRLWGPLWGFSMFGYENMNGFVKETFHGTRKILGQLAFHVRLRQSLPSIVNELCSGESTTTLDILDRLMGTQRRRNMQQVGQKMYVLGRISQQQPNTADRLAIECCTGGSVSGVLSISARMMKSGVIYTSNLHTLQQAHNDKVCMFDDNGETRFGVIKYFVIMDTAGPVAVLDVYEHTNTSVLRDIRPPRTRELRQFNSHSTFIFPVKKLSLAASTKAVRMSQVLHKCILIPQKGKPLDYVVPLVNSYEHH